MKRMTPMHRKLVAKEALVIMAYDWTCRHGEWNRDKIMDELERQLKTARRARK